MQSCQQPFGSKPAQWFSARLAWRAGLPALALWLVSGCSHALADRASRYAELGARSARLLRPVVTLVHRTCQESRRTEFLQQRLLRLKSESIGTALGPEYYLDGPHWSEMAVSVGNGQTWREYCRAMDRSAAVLAIALAALRAHADALGALAMESQGYDPDFHALYSGAEALEHGVTRQDSPWLKLVPPLVNPIKELSHLWLAEHNQASLRRMVVLAEPTVKQLMVALRQYLDAIAGQLATLTERQSTLAQSLEQTAGFGARAESSRSQRCHAIAPGSAPLDGELTQLCEWNRLQQRQLDALVLLQLHHDAERMAAAVSEDSMTLEGVQQVLAALSSSSTELANLAHNADEAALTKASQDLQRLSDALENLEDARNDRSALR